MHAVLLLALVLPLFAARICRRRRSRKPKRPGCGAGHGESADADYANKALGKALYRLGKALRGCGKSACTDATVAAPLVRDVASIHVRQRDKKERRSSSPVRSAWWPDLGAQPPRTTHPT